MSIETMLEASDAIQACKQVIATKEALIQLLLAKFPEEERQKMLQAFQASNGQTLEMPGQHGAKDQAAEQHVVEETMTNGIPA